jgi:membrane protein DedA with SNARE-associated domain
MLEWIQGVMAQFAYAGLAAVLLAAGLGVPIPEDIPLMVGGVLAAHDYANVFIVFGVAYVSILAGDFVIFSTGRRLGPVALAKPWASRVLTAQRQAQLNEHFRQHGFLTIVVARHLAGIRAPAFLMAGVAGMNPVKFLLADGFGACLSVPLFIFVGYKFGENLPAILATMKAYQPVALGVAVGLGLLAYLVRRWWRSRTPAADAPTPPPPAAPGPERP